MPIEWRRCRDLEETGLAEVVIDAIGRGPQAVAVLLLGSVGVLILGVDPVLLGPLVEERRLSDAGVGPLVTAELLAMAMGSIAGTRLLRRVPARFLAAAAGGAVALLNFLMIGVSGIGWLLPLRALTGLAEGMLVALPLVTIARSSRPEQLSAIFLVVQTVAQLGVAAALPAVALRGSAADAVLLALAGAGVAAVLLAFAAPQRLAPAVTRIVAGGLSPMSLVALAATGCYAGGLVTVWSFLGLWLSRASMHAIEGRVVAVVLACQVLGGLLAAKVGDRLPNRPAIAVAALVQVGVAGALVAGRSSPSAVLALGAVFGFLWLFALPSFTGHLIEIDPSRTAVLHVAAAQLLGSALVPLAAAGAVTRFGVAGAMLSAAAAFAAAAAAMLLQPVWSGRGGPAAWTP